MSYGKDPDLMLRGVGAVAAFDAKSPRRRRARIARARVMAAIDARRARLAHGPGRALPVPLGAISKAGAAILGGRTLTIKTGGSIGVPVPTGPLPEVPPIPPLPPPRRPKPRPDRLAVQPSSMSTGITGGGGVVMPGSGGGAGFIPIGPTKATTAVYPVTEPPPPEDLPPGDGGHKPGGGGGGSSGGGSKPSSGGGGGGSTWTMPPADKIPEFVAPPDEELPPPSGGSSSTGKTLLMVGAGIGLLYLLFGGDSDD